MTAYEKIYLRNKNELGGPGILRIAVIKKAEFFLIKKKNQNSFNKKRNGLKKFQNFLLKEPGIFLILKKISEFFNLKKNWGF
jgi:hypothetical protein